jgi:hypothetical protein
MRCLKSLKRIADTLTDVAVRVNSRCSRCRRGSGIQKTASKMARMHFSKVLMVPTTGIIIITIVIITITIVIVITKTVMMLQRSIQM